MLVDECLDVVGVARPGALDVDAADEVRLIDEPVRDASGAGNADAQDAGVLVAQLGAGNALRAIEVDDLAVVVQVVELAEPVRADGEDVDAILLDVVDLLAFVLLEDHLVGQATVLHVLDAIHQATAGR